MPTIKKCAGMCYPARIPAFFASFGSVIEYNCPLAPIFIHLSSNAK
jgi:hypothetical protein